MMSFGSLFSSFTVNKLSGLFVTAGILFGLGSSLTYTMCNNLPMQWFSSKLGTANGLVKLGGGLGATTMQLSWQRSSTELAYLGLSGSLDSFHWQAASRLPCSSGNVYHLTMLLLSTCHYSKACRSAAFSSLVPSVHSRSLFQLSSCHCLPTRLGFQLQPEQVSLQLSMPARQLDVLELVLPAKNSALPMCSY